jgi:hypothetical protein
MICPQCGQRKPDALDSVNRLCVFPPIMIGRYELWFSGYMAQMETNPYLYGFAEAKPINPALPTYRIVTGGSKPHELTIGDYENTSGAKEKVTFSDLTPSRVSRFFVLRDQAMETLIAFIREQEGVPAQ